MPITFRCEHCGQKLSVASRKAGADVKCPRCARETTVPGLEEVEAAERRAHAKRAAAGAGAAVMPAQEEFALRKPRTEFEDMDLTPMVDVTFLLLIFFMITASFSIQKTIETPDPNPDRKGAQPVPIFENIQLSSLKIDISADNRISIENEPVSDTQRLSDAILDKSNALETKDVLLTVEDQALHDTVIRVIDACNAARMQKIRLATSGAESD